jgi:hypothetical protein
MVNTLQYLPTPHSNRIAITEIPNPVNHDLYALFYLGLKPGSTELGSYVS